MTLTVTGMPPGATAIIAPSSWTALTSTSWSFPANTPLNQLSLTVQLPPALARLDRQDLTHRGLPPLLWGTLLLPFAGRLRRSGKRRGRDDLPAAVAGKYGGDGWTEQLLDQRLLRSNFTTADLHHYGDSYLRHAVALHHTHAHGEVRLTVE